MNLYVDTSTNQFVSDPLHRVPVDSVSFKRGDAANIELRFVEGTSVVPLESGASIVFGIKESGKFDGEFLCFADEYTSIGDSAYLIAPSFNTSELNDALNSDGDDSNDVASLSAMLEVTWSEDGTSWQSTDTITATIHNDIVKGSEGTPLELASPEDWLALHGISYVSTITGLTGGGSTKLDGIATVNLPVGTLRAVYVSSAYFSIYRLESTTSAESSPDTIRPDDYATGTNQKVWKLRAHRVLSLTASGAVTAKELRLINTGGAEVLFHSPNMVSNIILEIPDLSGDRKVCAVLEYANDSAAAAAGLAIGDIYYTGTKFRARTV